MLLSPPQIVGSPGACDQAGGIATIHGGDGAPRRRFETLS
jgi:hypothetical protein